MWVFVVKKKDVITERVVEEGFGQGFLVLT